MARPHATSPTLLLRLALFIGAWFGLTASFNTGGPLAHPALEMPETPCQVWTPSAAHAGYVFPLANRSLRIASSALSPPWLALGPSCVDNGLVGLGIRQVATTTICRCPTDRGATLGRVDTGGVLRGTIRLLLSFYQNPMIIYYSRVGTNVLRKHGYHLLPNLFPGKCASRSAGCPLWPIVEYDAVKMMALLHAFEVRPPAVPPFPGVATCYATAVSREN